MNINAEIERINRNNFDAIPPRVRERAERELEILELTQKLCERIHKERRNRSGKSPTLRRIIKLVLKHQDAARDRWINRLTTASINLLENLVFEEKEVRDFLESEKTETLNKNRLDN